MTYDQERWNAKESFVGKYSNKNRFIVESQKKYRNKKKLKIKQSIEDKNNWDNNSINECTIVYLSIR